MSTRRRYAPGCLAFTANGLRHRCEWSSCLSNQGWCVVMNLRGAAWAGVVAALGAIAGLAAQAPVAPAFDTVSIRASVDFKGYTGSPKISTAEFERGGRFSAVHASLRVLLEAAYPGLQLAGVPPIGDNTFDILATAHGDPPLDEMRLMLRTLLTQRFALKAHEATRRLLAYNLVAVSPNKTLGPQIRQSAGPCVNTPSNAPPDGSGLPRCADRFGSHLQGRGVAMADVTMDQFAAAVGSLLRTGVYNQTGLVGKFDVDVEFTSTTTIPEDFCLDQRGPSFACLPGTFGGGRRPVSRVPLGATYTWTASVFDVLPKQLGLKLISTRGPVNVLVVDHAGRPTTN